MSTKKNSPWFSRKTWLCLLIGLAAGALSLNSSADPTVNTSLTDLDYDSLSTSPEVIDSLVTVTASNAISSAAVSLLVPTTNETLSLGSGAPTGFQSQYDGGVLTIDVVDGNGIATTASASDFQQALRLVTYANTDAPFSGTQTVTWEVTDQFNTFSSQVSTTINFGTANLVAPSFSTAPQDLVYDVVLGVSAQIDPNVTVVDPDSFIVSATVQTVSYTHLTLPTNREV